MARPNILFILIDDMGWKDLSCMGSSFYETPNIDRIASEGMLFTDAYSAAPVCSPARASVLCGKYPARIGVTDWIDHGSFHPCKGYLVDAPYLKHLPLSEKSLAQALREGGYAAWHVGKWHLGEEPYWPEKHGFDVNVGGCHMGCPWHGYFSPWKIPTLSESPAGTYLDDRLADEAIALIRNGGDKPFFLNFWPYLVHMPPQAKPEKIAKYEAKAKLLGLDKLKAFEEGEPFPSEHKKTYRVRRRLLQSDPVYAAMIESLDDNVGRLLNALEELGKLDDTLVVFSSDNGGLATAEGSPTCNAPLSEGKGWMYEGGTREPLLVRWPRVVKAASKCQVPVSGPDFYPTLLEAAGLPLLPERHVDGESLLPLLRGGSSLKREAIYWHYPHYGNQGGTPGSSIRMGDWKLIEFFEDGRRELYNLREDVGESRDLAAAMPELRDEMARRLAAWREEVCAKMPLRNEAWKDGPQPPRGAKAKPS